VTAQVLRRIADNAFVAGDTTTRQEHLRIETLRHRILGTVTLPRDGYRSRVSDFLNASEREFLPLTDVTVTPLDGGPSVRHPFIALSRGHIVFAVSEEPYSRDELAESASGHGDFAANGRSYNARSTPPL
jgi:hypothetical protein